MTEKDMLRAIETLNAQIISLYASPEYQTGVLKNNVKRALSYKGLAKFKNALRDLKIFLAVRKEPRHPVVPNLSPDEWEERLQTGDPAKRVVVYSCVVGDYDRPVSPVWQAEHIDYVLYLDSENNEQVDGWEVRSIPDDVRRMSGGAPSDINRYIKFHPYELFDATYDACIYVDGNVQPVSDLSYYVELIDPTAGIALHHHRYRSSIADEVIACDAASKGNIDKMKEQVERYVREGYPLTYGLLECNVIATDLHNETGRAVFSDWWNEFRLSESGRDQLALPYVMWKRGIQYNAVATLGHDVYSDTKVLIYPHRR